MNRKSTLLRVVVGLIIGLTFGGLMLWAQGIKISEFPQATTLPNSAKFLLALEADNEFGAEPTNAFIEYGDLANQIASNQTTTIVNNSYVNNTQYVNQNIVTNLTVVNETHVGKLTVNSNAFITNTYFLTARAEDVTWPNGPTGAISFVQGSLQNYATWTPISITSVTGATNGFGNTILLCITNKSTTNITFTPPSGWQFGDGDTATCTNGKILEIWLFEASGRKTIATKSFH